MGYLKLAHNSTLLALILLAGEGLVGAKQLCFFGPDSKGNYLQKVVPNSTANSCGDFCFCTAIKESCLLGPDSAGNFATSDVDIEFAKTCSRATCTCVSHSDYTQTAQYRLSLAVSVLDV